MHLRKVVIDHDRYPTKSAYPFNLPVLQHSKTIEFQSPVTIFTGENGTGKSTLLTALCRKCNIHIWEGPSRSRCESNPYEQMFHRVLDIEWSSGSVPGSFFSPELFKHYTQLVDEWASHNPGQLEYFGGKSLMTQSHGQSCMSYFKARYKIKGLYFLDEPEAALSPTSQLSLLDVLTKMSSAGHGQFIISTHSPILMSCPNATIFNFNSHSIEPIPYKETSNYKVYEEFFENGRG